jgi:glycosyltransferase involved in cell wall biosynthesis
MQLRAVVFATQPADQYRAGRTLRSLKAAGLEAAHAGNLNADLFRAALAYGAPTLFIRAGAWFVRCDLPTAPAASATGRGLCAVGIVRAHGDTCRETQQLAGRAEAWRAASGGNFERGLPAGAPELLRAFVLDVRALRLLDAAGVGSLEEFARLASEQLRVIHLPWLDVYDDGGLRVLQAITALHRGGAERVTLDLLAELPKHNRRARLATLGRPLREAFPTPAGTTELAGVPGAAEHRIQRLAREAAAYGADVVHGHLICGTDAARISGAGLPVVLTVHNMRAGWPKGLAELRPGDVALLAACASAVERDVAAAKLPAPVRTARNGIELRAFQPGVERKAAGHRLRSEWGFADTDFVLLALANPRPQKRLHLLPGILAALRARLGGEREARLVICGETLRGNEDAERSVRETEREINAAGVASSIRWTGPVADVSAVLAAVDVLVSTSAHEGLSLAQLEALAMNLPVVATDVGGAREIARGQPKMRLMPPDAPAEDFAEFLATLALVRPSRETVRADGLARDPMRNWSREEMARRYRWLYPRAIAAASRRPGAGIWLIANNFSTGGAQSSARRLLAGFAGQGIRVRSAVVEETPAHPTPGRAALLREGIPVLSVDTGKLGTTVAAEQILAAIDADPPESVVFWNLRPSFKVLLADALIDLPVYDVSPGEMFFDSLDAYFAEQRTALPYHEPADYGARLAGVIVKYRAEAERAARVLGAPVHVIPNGIHLNGAGGRRQNGNGATLSFSTACRINPQKRLEDLLEAFRAAHPRLPRYTLKIAGGIERGCDEYAARLRKLSDGLPVEWMGEVADISGLHHASDVFVMISEPAGCPNASLEAMASGLPVIATDVGGASEQVIDRKTGRLVPARDSLPLADALVELASNRDLRMSLGLAARAHMEHSFSMERMLASYRALLLGGTNR